MQSTELVRYTEFQLESIRLMDHTVAKINSLKEGTLGPGDYEYMEDLKLEAAEHFWDATRSIGPNGEIIVDPTLVRVGSARLLERGIPQFVKHQVLDNLDNMM